MRPLLTLVAAVAIATPAIAAERYDYLLSGFYQGDAAGCATAAQDLATRFAAVSPDVRRAACENEQAGTFDLRIVYFADAKAPLVTTAPTPGVVEHLGVFASRSECEGDLSAESDRFQRLTRLTPFVSYCFYAEDSYDGRPWGIRIDGFGEAAVKPQLSGALIFGEPVGSTRGALAASVATGLANLGAETSFVTLRDQGGMSEMSALFYSAEDIDLRVIEHARTETLAQCEATLATVQRDLATLPHLLTSYCTEQFIGWFEMHTIGLGGDYAWRDANERFNSYDACQAQVADVVASYVTAPDSRTVHGLCSYDGFDRVWNVRLLERKPEPIDP